MVRLTLIARVADGLPLAEGLDDDKAHDLDQFKMQAKNLFKQMSTEGAQASRLSVDSGPFVFHYIIEGGVCYLTLVERAYPKKLAYAYLEDLRAEFTRLYSDQIETAARPYAFIKFDTFMQRMKKAYQDTRSQRNLSKLNEDLTEVHSIMTKNIQEVLGHGERLDRMSQLSAELTSESKRYATQAKDLYHQALLRKYVPIVAIVGCLIVVFYLRRVFY